MRCQFCNKGEGEISITDDETQQEVLICEDCDRLMVWEVEKPMPSKYQELTLQELEVKIDEVIDNQIDEAIAIRHGIEI